MLELPPRVVERDGDPVVVDQQGYELVLRTKRISAGENMFHTPDPDAAERGEKEILCRYGRMARSRQDSELLWRRRAAIEATWTLCPSCASDDPEAVKGGNEEGSSHLCSKLASDDETRAKVEAALQDAGVDATGGDA